MLALDIFALGGSKSHSECERSRDLVHRMGLCVAFNAGMVFI